MLLAVTVVFKASAIDAFPRVPPTPPEKAEATFEVLHGFRMELIAAEPLVASPVDLAYDEEGRAYVVEMRDYPFPEEKNAPPTEFPGTVRLIEDTDGDGKFDRSTIFADTLAWPTSVCCYQGGVFVAAAPDIWYFKDTDGDRQADIRRKVFTGFGRYNVQAIMNSLRWGLDNKIYGAAAGNGGSVRHAERASDPLVALTRRDFRFDPVSEQIEAISGGERYGACFDDWGNRFLCNIRNPVQHVVLPLHYLARNPNLIVPSVIHDAAEAGDQLRVFRLSPPEPWRQFRAQRWALEQAAMPRSELIGAGYWTSSSGVCVYRGAAYPESFRGNVFIGEVAGNLVHRQILTREGATFKSRRADENTEFVRSTDNWFRPVNFINAPDGTLTVLDMYRETIEHPWSIPDDIKAQLDLSSGKERGRLYRLTPPGFNKPSAPRLSKATTAELVAHLRSPHGWWRETAQRLLFERQDKDAVPLVRDVLRDAPSPRAKLHALYTLAGLGGLTTADIKTALNNRYPDLVRHALVLAEKLEFDDADRITMLVGALEHPDESVHLQVALSVGSMELPPSAVVGVLGKCAASDRPIDRSNPWMRAAILSSSEKCAGKLLEELIVEGSTPLVRQLAYHVGTNNQQQDAKAVLGRIAKPLPFERMNENVFAILIGFGQGFARHKIRLTDLIANEPWEEAIQRRFQSAAASAGNRRTALSQRLTAIEFLAWSSPTDAKPVLLAALEPAEPRELQQAAIRLLGSRTEADIAGELIARFRQLTPPTRDEAMTVLLSRPIWHAPLVAALEKGDIPVAQVSIPQRGRLAAIKDAKLAERAKAVLASVALGPRKEVLDKYQAALLLAGDAPRGQIVYRRECANCHKLRGEGHDVGPSLETVQHRSPQEILIHVLDPSREVSPNFLDYQIRLSDGRALTGMIASETDAGLTLRRAGKQEDEVPRSQIEEIASSGKSLMPEGLEQKITLQELSDVIAFLKSPPPSP